MSSDSGGTPSDKRKKTTEVTDLPDASVSEDQAGDVKGGSTIVPCVQPSIPCIRGIPCVRGGLPPRPYKPGGL